MRDDDLRRRLRSLESELEAGNLPLRPARPDARRGIRMRPAAAGLGMAASIAATVALFSQALPTKDAASLRPGSITSTSPLAPTDPTSSPASSRSTTDSPAPSASGEPTPVPGTIEPTVLPPGDVPACSLSVPDPSAPPEGIAVSAEADPMQVRGGESITLRAVFRNNRAVPVTNDEGNPRADFVVYHESGTPVWRYSDGRAFTQEIRTVTYQPGEEVAAEVTWNARGCDDGQLPPGRYLVRAFWAGPNGGTSEPIPVQIA